MGKAASARLEGIREAAGVARARPVGIMSELGRVPALDRTIRTTGA